MKWTIKLEYCSTAVNHGLPHQIWLASADLNGSPMYDAAGATPLDAMTGLAESLAKRIPA